MNRRTAAAFLLGGATSLFWQNALAGALVPIGSVSKEVHAPLRFFYASPDSPAVSSLLALLKTRYPAAVHTSSVADLQAGSGSRIYIAVGFLALSGIIASGVLSYSENVVVSLFVSRQRFASLVDSLVSESMRVSAIYSESAPESNLQLIQNIFGSGTSVDLLVSPQSEHLGKELRHAAQDYALSLNVQTIPNEGNIARTIAEVSKSAVLLAIPDNQLYQPINVQAIIESCYRRRQPIVGFVPAMVQAGAVATTYATPEDVLRQLDETLAALGNQRLPAPSYPRYWRVVINEKVARSLNIPIPDSARNLEGSRKRG